MTTDIGSLGPQAAWEAYLRAGEFRIQRAASTGEHIFYPKVVTPQGATDLEWVKPSGLGTVYAITVNRDRAGAWNVALVDLDEGVRMFSTILDVETVPVGTRVRAELEPYEDTNRVVFRVIDAAAEGVKA